MSLFRIVEPVSGTPKIRISIRPVTGWIKRTPQSIRGNSHLRFEIREENLRLTTNMSLTFLCEESTSLLQEKIYFGLSWSSPIEEDIAQVSEHFFLRTRDYWRAWVKHCSIPSQFQRQTIRSALALKLHCYEDTGAILAALTTSLPEARESGRNWDYRYCWLRDAHFSLSAFRNLGHFEEMEGFLKFFLGLVQRYDLSQQRLSPVYTLSQGLPLPELVREGWCGFAAESPVRTNNQAAEHVQNDVYGEMILTLSPIFFDERFVHLRNETIEALLCALAQSCDRSIAQPDAGLWELRQGWQEHSFTNLMCWAGLDRTMRLQELGFLRDMPLDLYQARDRALSAVQRAVVEGSLRNGPGDSSFDSALLLAAILRYPDETICLPTVTEIQRHLALGSGRPESSFFYRYARQDDFGTPASAFMICSFWMAQALARIGFRNEARMVLEDATAASNHVGLFSEHFQPISRQQLGNFPQAYSHVGLINAAFAVSPPWSDVL